MSLDQDKVDSTGLLTTPYEREPEVVGELVAELEEPGNRLIIVIGGADTGKTALIGALGGRLAAKADVGIVDADIGQSHLGPPTTVAWGKTGGTFDRWDSITVRDFYFTGAVSPPGNLLQLLAGTKLMADRARAACEKILVDTTGLVEQSAGVALKRQKIDLLRPDFVIALQRKDELAPILDPLRFMSRPRVRSVRTPAEVRSKSPVERTGYRNDRLRSYFRGASTIICSLKKTGLHFTRGDAGSVSGPAGSLRGRLVSLRDNDNRDRALGIIEDFQEGKILRIRTPLKEVEKVACIVVGTLGDITL